MIKKKLFQNVFARNDEFYKTIFYKIKYIKFPRKTRKKIYEITFCKTTFRKSLQKNCVKQTKQFRKYTNDEQRSKSNKMKASFTHGNHLLPHHPPSLASCFSSPIMLGNMTLIAVPASLSFYLPTNGAHGQCSLVIAVQATSFFLVALQSSSSPQIFAIARQASSSATKLYDHPSRLLVSSQAPSLIFVALQASSLFLVILKDL